MESLLRWGIQNTEPVDPANHTAPAPRKDLDPAILDAILGRPDAEVMKEAMGKAIDTGLTEEQRITALDDMEMLVESIDNANDLEKLGIWEQLHTLITTDPSEKIKTQALWVIGTAVQNNPAAQRAYLGSDPLPTILSFLKPSIRSPQLRSKAVYTLSGLLKHNAAAVSQLNDNGGWEIFRAALEDSDIGVRRKTAFLLNSLLIPISEAAPAQRQAGTTATGATLHPSDSQATPSFANSHLAMARDPLSANTAPVALKALKDHELLKALVRALVTPTPHGANGDEEGDVDLEERIAALLHTYVEAHNGQFSPEEKKELNEFFAEKRRSADDAEVLGLSSGELQTLLKAVQ
ncbi:nucleotide exchange factors-like protein [Dentipellis sp. KUC8613]|nr:nucleotide exchange factors-like protein [Dentipellis sp. KUC8613]